MNRKIFRYAVVAVCIALLMLVPSARAVDSARNSIANLFGKTDGVGSLYVVAVAASGVDSARRSIANLLGKTDGNGNLYVALAAASVFPSPLYIGATDVALYRDAANVLAQRNSTNAQKMRWYKTFTDASNGEWAEIDTTPGSTMTIGTLANGTGTVRNIGFATAGSLKWFIDAASGGFLKAATDNTVDIGATGANRPKSLFLAAPAITPGAATGVTVNNSGEVKELQYQVTVATTAFTCAAVTCDVTIGTLPADTFLVRVDAKLTTTFACTATCTSSTLSFILGKGAGGSEYLASFDADAATGVFGDADAEMGTLMTRAAAIQGGTYNTASQAVVLRLTSGTGNIGTGAATNLSQGSVNFTLTTRVTR